MFWIAALKAHRPESFEILPSESKAGVLLCAEHAGAFVPPRLRQMGLPDDELRRHIGWDIGIGETVRRLHAATGLPAILGQISRLVVDLNRPVTSDECIIEFSDGTPIPANQNLSGGERSARISEYYFPFHRALNGLIAEHRPKILLCLHSFTPKLRTAGWLRPWSCGVLFDRQTDLGRACISHLERRGDIIVGENQPYRVDHDCDQPVPLHGELKGVPTLLLEIRNDLIADEAGQDGWAGIIADLVSQCLAGGPGRSLEMMEAA